MCPSKIARFLKTGTSSQTKRFALTANGVANIVVTCSFDASLSISKAKNHWSYSTNHLNFGATTIASIYKDRWQIEVFFKALKQNLKIKSFVGTSPNAIYIQIWTALIAMLLLKWLHYLSKAKWSMSNLAAMLRLNLFTYRELQAWLDHPFSTPPVVPLSTQLDLRLEGLGQLPFGSPANLLPQESGSGI